MQCRAGAPKAKATKKCRSETPSREISTFEHQTLRILYFWNIRKKYFVRKKSREKISKIFFGWPKCQKCSKSSKNTKNMIFEILKFSIFRSRFSIFRCPSGSSGYFFVIIKKVVKNLKIDLNRFQAVRIRILNFKKILCPFFFYDRFCSIAKVVYLYIGSITWFPMDPVWSAPNLDPGPRVRAGASRLSWGRGEKCAFGANKRRRRNFLEI